MSEEDVTQVFGPGWVREEMEFLRKRLQGAEDHILNLRHELRRRDPTLPDPYDGRAWYEWEQKGILDE